MRQSICVLWVVLGLGAGCGPGPAPQVIDGVADLRSWDFDRNGPIAVAGSWELAYGQLLVDDGHPLAPTPDRLEVPGNWGGETSSGPASAMGFGTLRVRVLLPSSGPFSVYLTHADTAYTLHALDARSSVPLRLMSAGVVARDAAHSVPSAVPAMVQLPTSTELTLLLQISNFEYPKGGAGGTLRLGRSPQMQRERNEARQREFAIIGALVIVGLYHLALFLLRPSDRAPLWFAVFCFSIALRNTERGFFLPELLPEWDWWLSAKRIEFATLDLAVPMFCLYSKNVLPRFIQDAFIRGIVMINVCFAIVVVVTPAAVFAWTAVPLEITSLGGIAWLLLMFVRASIIPKAWDARVILLGMIIIAIGAVNDTLVSYFVLSTPFLLGAALACFVLCQAVVLAMGAARARHTAEELAVRLLHLDKLKNEFLANTSHELRTPLNAIINIPHALLAEIEERSVLVCQSCGALYEVDDDSDPKMACGECQRTTLVVERRRFPPDDADAMARHLGSIIGSGQHLLGLVNDILDHSKLAAGRFQITRVPTAVDDVVTQAVQSMAALARVGGVELISTVAPALRVDGDQQRMVQVLVNLIANAVKFSPRGGTVEVVAAVDGAFVLLQVIDHGIGISPEHHEMIFDSFQQVEGGHTRSHGGTGLGLAIVRQLVELHDGTVGVRSALGAGATFEVRLPALLP